MRCEECNGEFTPKSDNDIFCSKECSSSWVKRDKMEEYRQDYERDLYCRDHPDECEE